MGTFVSFEDTTIRPKGETCNQTSEDHGIRALYISQPLVQAGSSMYEIRRLESLVWIAPKFEVQDGKFKVHHSHASMITNSPSLIVVWSMRLDRRLHRNAFPFMKVNWFVDDYSLQIARTSSHIYMSLTPCRYNVFVRFKS